jgi:MYXO-CTERM domain-containing protein
MNRLLACLTVVGLTLAAAHDASAAMPLLTGLGGTNGFGTGCMPPNDDGTWPSTGGLDITGAFPQGLKFYAGTYTQVYINNNGNISFGGAINTYTPDAFPGAPQPMIAPYWADVDTRTMTGADTCSSYPSGGSFPAGTVCTNPNPTTDVVEWSITPGQFVVTWYNVGYYSCLTDHLMSFQMILSTVAACGGSSGMDFDIEFRYNVCGWEAGDASGGTDGFCGGNAGCTPAQAGFDSGQGASEPAADYASLPMSRMNGIGAELCDQSNLTPAVPGDWKFSVIGGAIMCPTAGQPCQTGMPGVCADGQLQCGVSGTTTCVPLTPAGPTQCNGLDNNCDGTIDTGPCPSGTVCDGTACVPVCLEGGCPTGETCTSAGVCVETDCVNVTCPAGERCIGGSCVDDCTGVTCPIDQVCRVGNCVDPCANLNCGMGQVCENGACVPSCPCTACTSSQTCVATGPQTGQCVDTACATVTCPAGQVCQSGNCIDACTGAVCPMHEACTAGNCVAGSGGSDAGTDGGVVLHLDGGLNGDASFGGDASGGGDSSTGDDGGDGDNDFGGTKSGCSCHAAGDEGGSTQGWLAAMGIGLAAMAVRRRRATRPER